MMKRKMLLVPIAMLTPAASLAQKAAPAPVSARNAADAAKMHEMIDTNHDGKVSRQEMQLFGIEHRLGVIVNNRTWNRSDADRNGSLSVTELTRHIADVRAAKQAARPHSK